MAIHETKAWMNIFFDLDGTLINSTRRLYELFQHLVPASTLSFDEYWKLKRNKISHLEILKDKFSFTMDEIKLFEQRWMERIELPEWIALDRPFKGITEYLNELKLSNKLFIITARQSETMLINQMSQFGWTGIFDKVLITFLKQGKYDIIKNSVETKNTDWIVGDTEEEIQTGKRLGIKTVAVLSGFRNEEILINYKPDIIVKVVTDLKAPDYER